MEEYQSDRFFFIGLLTKNENCAKLGVWKTVHNNLTQFRKEVYQNFNKRADTLMEMLDALCSQTRASSVVELSLESCFQRSYSAIFKAMDEYRPGDDDLAQLAGPSLPEPQNTPLLAARGGCDPATKDRMPAHWQSGALSTSRRSSGAISPSPSVINTRRWRCCRRKIPNNP